MSEPSLVVILVRTVARSPSMLSPMNWIFSPPYTSIFEMYERSRRSAKSWTNSARSAGVRGAQWRGRERGAGSEESKMSLAICRTAARRSRARGSFFSSGSSRTFRTRSIWARSCSVGGPAHAGCSAARSARSAAANTTPQRRTLIGTLLDLPKDVLGQQLLEIDRRLDLADPAAGRDDLLPASPTYPYVLLTDQPLGLDRRDRVVLELDVPDHAQRHARLVVGQPDRFDAPDLDARDLDGGAGLEPADRRKVDRDHVPAAAEEGNPSESNRKVPQSQDAEQHEHADRDVDARPLHQLTSARSGSPRMNWRTTRVSDSWMAAGGPTSTIRPSCSIATRSAISKISGISWLTITAVKRKRWCRSWISRWIVLTRIGSRPVVGSSKKMISGSMTRARAIATRLRMPPEISAGYLPPTPSRPTWASAASTRLATSARGSRSFSRSGNATLSTQVIESKSAPPWKTTP